jgi:hypothetical protein
VSEQQTTIIELPEELRPKLEAKLREYQGRLNDAFAKDGGYKPPETYAAWYAVRILSTLLRDGRIDTWALAREIAAEHGGYIVRLDAFDNYCAVIDGYASGKILL